jgi:protein-S-isoprenylcysteine O-methyltransferase Ste14
VIDVQKHNECLGSEHRLCDLVQLIMITLFFVVWTADLALHFLFRASSVILNFTTFPLLLIPAVMTSSFGVYLISKSHNLVFGKQAIKDRVIDFNVYSWVRHPMYLGSLLFGLGFFFASLSLASLAVWVAFFFMYDKMTKHEESELMRILGNQYVAYKKRVPKWIPKIKK